MQEICPKCGLPKDLCICDILEKEAQQQKIKIFTETRKFGKIVTIVEGINKEYESTKQE
jgi:translation initiation factor 1